MQAHLDQHSPLDCMFSQESPTFPMIFAGGFFVCLFFSVKDSISVQRLGSRWVTNAKGPEMHDKKHKTRCQYVMTSDLNRLVEDTVGRPVLSMGPANRPHLH